MAWRPAGRHDLMLMGGGGGDGQFQRYETKEDLNVSTLKDGVYCLLCRSLHRDVPSQGRGWRLCTLITFDVDHDKIAQLRRFCPGRKRCTYGDAKAIAHIRIIFRSIKWVHRLRQPSFS